MKVCQSRPGYRIALAVALLLIMLGARATVSADVAPPPSITNVGAPILVGGSFVISGNGFISDSVVNFFVATANGPVNKGPLTPSTSSPGMLVVPVPVSVTQGEGVVSVQVVNTDGHGNPINQPSNVVTVLLQGSAAEGLPSIASIDGIGLAPDSANSSIAVANVQTVVLPGKTVTIGGNGFDTAHGVAVNLFCGCPGGKVGPFLLSPDDPGLSAGKVSFLLPSSGPNAPVFGPGSFEVINKGADGLYTYSSAAVSTVIGQRVTIASVTQNGHVVTVTGSGFSKLMTINFFNLQNGAVFNVGGIPDSCPISTNLLACQIPLNVISPRQFAFVVPPGVMNGPAYVQAINPPYTPFSSSGNTFHGALSVNSAPVYAYVVDGLGSLEGFSASQSAPSRGSLVPVGPPITVGVPGGPIGVLVDPTNSYVYVTDQVGATVSAFIISQSVTNPGVPLPDGALVPTGSGATAKPNRMAAHPNGLFLYVANVGDGTISAFSIVQTGPDAGQLIADGPPVASGSMPQYLSVDPTGRFLYATNSGDSTVSAFTIVQSGASAGQLVKNGSPLSVPSVGGIAVDPSGKYAYVVSDTLSNPPSTVVAFNIVQSGATTGQLVPNGPPVTVFGNAQDLLVDPLGLYVVVSSLGGTSGGILAITQTGPEAGQLTSQPGSAVAPFVLGSGSFGFHFHPDQKGSPAAISDFWMAGGTPPSFVLEPLDGTGLASGEPLAVAATN